MPSSPRLRAGAGPGPGVYKGALATMRTLLAAFHRALSCDNGNVFFYRTWKDASLEVFQALRAKRELKYPDEPEWFPHSSRMK